MISLSVFDGVNISNVCVCVRARVCVRHTHSQTNNERQRLIVVVFEVKRNAILSCSLTLLTCKIVNLIIRTVAAKLIVYDKVVVIVSLYHFLVMHGVS